VKCCGVGVLLNKVKHHLRINDSKAFNIKLLKRLQVMHDNYVIKYTRQLTAGLSARVTNLGFQNFMSYHCDSFVLLHCINTLFMYVCPKVYREALDSMELLC